jgi:hypothetical protein
MRSLYYARLYYWCYDTEKNYMEYQLFNVLRKECKLHPRTGHEGPDGE